MHQVRFQALLLIKPLSGLDVHYVSTIKEISTKELKYKHAQNSALLSKQKSALFSS